MRRQDEIEAFCREGGLLLLVLFGSRAGGKEQPGSDVDIAVKTRPDAEGSKLDLIFRLGEFFGDREIDLVLLTPETDALLLHEIFEKGRLLYEAEPGIFEDERLRAWKLYLDTEPLRRRLAAYLKQSAKEMNHVA